LEVSDKSVQELLSFGLLHRELWQFPTDVSGQSIGWGVAQVN